MVNGRSENGKVLVAKRMENLSLDGCSARAEFVSQIPMVGEDVVALDRIDDQVTHWVRLHKGTKSATGYSISIICWKYFYLSPKKVEKTPEIDARESPLRLTAVHSPVSCGHINVLGEYDSSEKSSAILSTSSHPKKHRREWAKTGEEIVVITAVYQITRTIPVADLVHLCRRTPCGRAERPLCFFCEAILQIIQNICIFCITYRGGGML